MYARLPFFLTLLTGLLLTASSCSSQLHRRPDLPVQASDTTRLGNLPYLPAMDTTRHNWLYRVFHPKTQVLPPIVIEATPASLSHLKVKGRAQVVLNVINGNNNHTQTQQASIEKNKAPAQQQPAADANLNVAQRNGQLTNAPKNSGTFTSTQTTEQEKTWRDYLLSPLGKTLSTALGIALLGGGLWLLIAWRKKKALDTKRQQLASLGSKAIDLL